MPAYCRECVFFDQKISICKKGFDTGKLGCRSFKKRSLIKETISVSVSEIFARSIVESWQKDGFIPEQPNKDEFVFNFSPEAYLNAIKLKKLENKKWLLEVKISYME